MQTNIRDEGYVRYEELAWRLKTRTGDSMQHLNSITINLIEIE